MSLHSATDFALDGNAAGGLLSEIFAVEITSAIVTCAHCGAFGEMGGARVYGGEMGAIFRCTACDGIVARLARTPEGFTLDMRGMRSLSYARNG